MQKFLSVYIFVGVFTTVTLHPDPDPVWEAYKRQHGKEYTMREDQFRYSIWKGHHILMGQHNAKYDQGQHTYRMGPSEFMDSLHTEWPKSRENLASPKPQTRQKSWMKPEISTPSSIDWRQKGCVSPVYNQGQFGESWCLVSADTFGSDMCALHGKLVAPSAQNLLDCCNMTAPWPGGAFQCIHNMSGIDSLASYPYTGKKGPCKFNPESSVGTCSGSEEIPSGDEAALQTAVARVGPVAVEVDASHPSFMMYSSGVYDEPSCSSTQLDHILLVVGYGSQDGVDYWIAKNSWGMNWGMDGYILMARNKNNQCGIASLASYPHL